jgi:hypothetical protein
MQAVLLRDLDPIDKIIGGAEAIGRDVAVLVVVDNHLLAQ